LPPRPYVLLSCATSADGYLDDASPARLIYPLLQPVLIMVLFVSVMENLASSVGGASYRQFLIPGIMIQNVVLTAPVTGLAIVRDADTGLADRFRSLPMSRWAVLMARSIAELLTQIISTVVVVCVGLAIGWRVHTNALDVIAALALALLFGYAFTWVGVCLGMVLRSPEAAQQTGFIIFLPLTFISSAFVPTQSMPGWLQPVAEWNPMSSLAAACRSLFGNPNPASQVHAWPAQHPELAVVCWSLGLLVIFAPLAVRLYGNKVH